MIAFWFWKTRTVVITGHKDLYCDKDIPSYKGSLFLKITFSNSNKNGLESPSGKDGVEGWRLYLLSF